MSPASRPAPHELTGVTPDDKRPRRRSSGQAYDAGTAAIEALAAEAGWQARIEAQAVALRQVLARNPGGAILFAGSPKVLSAGALSLMERMLTTLAEAGVPQEHRGVAADTLFSLVAGYVLQEQIEALAGPVTQEGAEALTERFPLTFAAASEHDDDEQFLRSVRLICGGVAALSDAGKGGASSPEVPERPTAQFAIP